MFRTSEVVYLVAVFFLMRHFKLFNVVEKTTKIKDKTYLMGFKFAAIYVGAKALEMVMNEVLKHFPGFNVPSLNMPGMPLIEGHSGCNLVMVDADGVVQGEGDAQIVDPASGRCGQPNADGRYEALTDGGANPAVDAGDVGMTCSCQPNPTPAFVVTAVSELVKADGSSIALPATAGGVGESLQCTANEVAGGICPTPSVTEEDVAAGRAADAGHSCCHPEIVQRFYAHQQGIWEAHQLDSEGNFGSSGHADSVGVGVPDLPAGWAAHIMDMSAAGLVSARQGNYQRGTYTVPGSGGQTCSSTMVAREWSVDCNNVTGSSQATCNDAAGTTGTGDVPIDTCVFDDEATAGQAGSCGTINFPARSAGQVADAVAACEAAGTDQSACSAVDAANECTFR